MGDNRNPRKLIGNEMVPFAVTQKNWETGDCTLVSVDGCAGFMLAPKEFKKDGKPLATNFFSIELMNVDPDDDGALARFMGKHGLLDCPLRENGVPVSSLPLLNAVTQTNEARTYLVEEYMRRQFDGELAPVILPHRFVTYDEARAVLLLLQNTVRGLFSWLDSALAQDLRVDTDVWDNLSLFAFVNKNASNPNQVTYTSHEEMPTELPLADGEIWTAPIDFGSLTGAISSQIIETVADPAEWYRCKASGCGRWFKRKRGTDNPRTNSEYCSMTCSERIRKQKWRNRKAADINTQ